MSKPRIIVLFGAQGSGKGTQARLIQEKTGLPQVATGDLFRYNLRHNTPLGQLAKSYISKGDLVPDGVTNQMVKDRLQNSDAQAGVILDGYPRNIAQAQALDEMLTELSASFQAVYIEVPQADLMRRLTGRRICKGCQASYHIVFNPPKTEGVCDKCAGQLYQRDDDKENATIARRLEVYFEETTPVIEWYRALGLLAEVDGSGGIEVVNQSIVESL
ncbi:MAG: adenylate kinase [Ardenticatenaceae bacterium]